MALFYTQPMNGFSKSEKISEVHINQEQRILMMHSSAMEITSLQADGDELSHILANFSGIPTCKKRVQCWFGDDAKFIAAHF